MSYFSKGTQHRTTKMIFVAKTYILEGEQKKSELDQKKSETDQKFPETGQFFFGRPKKMRKRPDN